MDVGPLIEALFPLLVVWLMMSLRFMGFAMVFPWFTWLNLPLTIRFAFAAAMGLPFAYVVSQTQADILQGLEATALGLLAVKEILIGAGIGLLAGVPIWAAQSGGEIIDTYRGSSAGNLFDPSLTTETSELGVVFTAMALAVLTWSGGVQALVWAIYGSINIWPIFELTPTLELDQAPAVALILKQFVTNAVAIAAVLLTCMFAADLALGLISRSVQQFQVFELSLNIKNMVYAFLMPVFALPILSLVTDQLRPLSNLLELLESLIQ